MDIAGEAREGEGGGRAGEKVAALQAHGDSGEGQSGYDGADSAGHHGSVTAGPFRPGERDDKARAIVLRGASRGRWGGRGTAGPRPVEM
ncbi:hypothetical protein GCM10009116_17610 [Brevundimonas basaltis]